MDLTVHSINSVKILEEEIFNTKVNQEKSALMLDYSETLLEGADSIASAHMYDFSEEENMLMVAKKIEYLLERISKYYMAINVGFNTTTNKRQLAATMEKIEENIEKINLYTYSNTLEKERVKMNEYWKENKIFFEKSEKLFIPNLLLSSVAHLEEVIEQIALYHSKNQ